MSAIYPPTWPTLPPPFTLRNDAARPKNSDSAGMLQPRETERDPLRDLRREAPGGPPAVGGKSRPAEGPSLGSGFVSFFGDYRPSFFAVIDPPLGGRD